MNDLRSLATSSDWSNSVVDTSVTAGQVIGLDNFDYDLCVPETSIKKLNMVEGLLQKQSKLMIFSAAEPSQYKFHNGEDGKGNGEQDLDGRWAVLMSQFFTEYAEDTGDPEAFHKRVEEQRKRILERDLKGRPAKEVNGLIDLLSRECEPKGPLQRIGLQILSSSNFATITRAHLLNRIVNQARTYYLYLWNSCSVGEKLTLAHLAQDRLLSHRDPDIERLLRRELIKRDEDVHLMNDSFREFVKSSDQIVLMKEHDERAKEGSLWQMLKGPMLFVLVAIAVFLFVTQRDLYMSSLALVTAITTIIPAFFKLLSLFQSDPLGRAPTQT